MARHILPGLLRVFWLTTAPALAAPTQASLTAGTNLIGTKGGEGLAEINGFKPSPAVFDTPDYIDAVVGNVGGTATYPSSSLVFYSDVVAMTIENILTAGSAGWVVFGFKGSASTKPSIVFPATVLANDPDPSRSSAAMFEVSFGVAGPTKGAFAV